MEISKKGLDLIKKFEGCRLSAYQDSIGVWTIGYGHIQGVRKGDVCTQDQADEWLANDVKTASSAVGRLVKVPLDQNEFDALVSFTFNLGQRNLQNSTLLSMLNSNDVEGAANQFIRWNKAGGKVVDGLTKRRQAEKDLFLGMA